MENEKFLLCDCKAITTKDNRELFYLVVYSSFEILERVFVTKDDFDFVVKSKGNININDFLERSYNRTKQTFTLRLKRK